MKNKFLTLIAVLAFSTSGLAQLATPLSQFSGNQMLYNPGYSGIYDILSVNLNIHRGWINLPGAPNRVALNAHMPSKNQRHAFGAAFQSDSWGPLQGNFLHLNYAYKLHVGQGVLSLGLQAGGMLHVTDWEKITHVRHREDVTLGQGREREAKLDVSAGAYYLASQWYAGFSVLHLNAPKYGVVEVNGEEWFSRMSSQFVLIGGYNFDINPRWSLRPEILMLYTDAVPLVTNIGIHAHYMNRYSLGVNIMGARGISFQARALFNEQFRIGYSYDIFYGFLRPYQRGSHEISVSYIIPNFHKNERTVNLLWL
jgi:type IX secretion system PorP/SprF family membrane protein